MIPILIVFCILFVISAKIYIDLGKKDIENVLEKKELDEYTKGITDNISMCNEILDDLGVENVAVKLSEDKESTTSFYNVFSRQIVLCDNEKANKSFARVLYIAHECVHASQNQLQLKFNFILANINLIFCVVSTILVWCNVIQQSTYLVVLGIALVIYMFSFFARNAIESDATFMSVIEARNYLLKYIDIQKVKIMEKEYIKIIYKGYTTFIFSLFSNNIWNFMLLAISMIVCTYIY